MGWTLALNRNHKMLSRLIAQLFVMSGLAGDGSVVEMPRHLRSRVFRVLLPAESALRALIVVAAFVIGMRKLVAVARQRSAPKKATARASAKRKPAFRLFDPRVNFNRKGRWSRGVAPRMFFFDGTDEVAGDPTVSPDDPVNAAALYRRLEAARTALEDLPNQVRRLAQTQARRAAAKKPPREPIRAGRRPGHRVRPVHYVDLVLRECQQLALMAMAAPDSS